MVVRTDPLEFAIFKMRFSRKHNFIFCSAYATMEYTQRYVIITCYHMPLITCSKLIQKTRNIILGMLLILNMLIINLNLGTNLIATTELNIGTISQIISKILGANTLLKVFIKILLFHPA